MIDYDLTMNKTIEEQGYINYDTLDGHGCEPLKAKEDYEVNERDYNDLPLKQTLEECKKDCNLHKDCSAFEFNLENKKCRHWIGEVRKKVKGVTTGVECSIKRNYDKDKYFEYMNSDKIYLGFEDAVKSKSYIFTFILNMLCIKHRLIEMDIL